MSRGEEKCAQLAAVVHAILSTGTSVEAVVDMFASVLRACRFAHEADLIETAVRVMMGAPSDVEKIAEWFDAQATKERDLLDSGRCNNPSLAEERWLVYTASAQSVRANAWRAP